MVPGRSTHSHRHAADCARRGQQRTDLEVVTPVGDHPRHMGGPLKSIPASQPRRAGTPTGWAWTRLSSLTTANKDTRQPGPATGSSPPLQSAGSPERGWTSCAPAVYSSPPSTAPSAATCWYASPVRAARPPEGTSWRTSSSCTSAVGARPVHTQSWDGPRPPASSAGRSCGSRRGLVASRSLTPPRRDPPRGESERRAPPRNLQASDAPMGSQGRPRTWWWSGQVW